ncbi:MAG: ABC transporter ATP-binding protein [Acidobacteria bacterium]|nr:ABC transporter ATP-binding protein [Acidobacteriota bacterium]
MATPLIQIDSLVKQYTRDTQVLTVLDKLSLSVEDGDFVALMGPSGSGKTTLLNLIAGIDRPTSGRILVGDAEVSKMSEAALAKWRSANVGFIFQLYNLVPVLTAYENVELPLLLTNLNRARRRKQVELALSVVGLADRMDHYPRQLSGGQEQRVAIARAIATDPKLLVADEPTGDLDSKSGEEILILMERLNAEFRKTIVMVTHDPKAASRAHRLVHLDKGVLKEDVHAEKGKAVGMAAAISASAT